MSLLNQINGNDVHSAREIEALTTLRLQLSASGSKINCESFVNAKSKMRVKVKMAINDKY